MIKSFHHVALSVTNLERSIAFYTNVFEMEPVCPAFPFGGEQYESVLELKGVQGKMCPMKKGDFYLELFEFAQPQPATKNINYSVADHGITHFGVEVVDIEGTYNKMVEAGVRFHSPITQFASGMKATYGRDPDGNVFELLERCPVAK